MTDKFPAGPYIVANVHEAEDMDADAFHEDTLGIYAKSDFDNEYECPSALAIVNHNWGGVEDIAKLFAAAPGLLAALEAVVRVADRKTAEFDMARAAIAAARGTDATLPTPVEG